MPQVAVVQGLFPFDVTKEPCVPMPDNGREMIGPLGRLVLETDFHQKTLGKKRYWFGDGLCFPECALGAWYEVFLAPENVYYPAVRLVYLDTTSGQKCYSGSVRWLMGTDGLGLAKTEQEALELWARWTRELSLARLVHGYGTEGYPLLERVSTYAASPVYCSDEIRRRLGANMIYLLTRQRSKQSVPRFYLGTPGLGPASEDLLTAADAYAGLGTQKRLQSIANEAMRLPEENHPEHDWGMPREKQ